MNRKPPRTTLYWQEILEHRLVLAALLLAATITGLVSLYMSTDPGTVLTALATAQASILAIVFSVTILGVQLIANRYSPGMTSLITGDRIFKWTFWILVASVTYDLLAVYLLPGIPDHVDAILISGAVLLAALAVFALWQYVNTVLRRSTPGGLLEAFAARMTPTNYWQKYQETTEDETASHPFHDLFEMTMAALTNREWLTATKGLETMKQVIENTIQDLANTGKLEVQTPPRTSPFDEPLNDFLPRIAVHAGEEEETEITHRAIDLQLFVGEQGLKQYLMWLPPDAARGLRITNSDAPGGWDGTSIRTKAFNNIGSLLISTIEHPDPRNAEKVLMHYRNELEQSLNRNYPAQSYRGIVDDCFRDHVPAAFAALLENYDEYIQSMDLDWSQLHVDREIQRLKPIVLSFALRRSLVKLSARALDFEERVDEFPGTKTQLVEGWRRSCAEVAESRAERFAVVLFQDFIELAYAESTHGDDTRVLWVRSLAQLWNDGQEEIIAEAFSNVRDQGRPERNFRGFYGWMEEPRPSVWVRVVDSVVGAREEFGVWVYAFEEDVRKRAGQLSNS